MNNNVLALNDGSITFNTASSGGTFGTSTTTGLNGTTANTTWNYGSNGYWLNGYWYPYNNTLSYSYPVSSDAQIRKVANGFIVTTNGQEYVFNSLKKMNAFLNKELGKK